MKNDFYENPHDGEALREMWYENNLADLKLDRSIIKVLFSNENKRILNGESYDEKILEFCHTELDKNEPSYQNIEFKKQKKIFEKKLKNRVHIPVQVPLAKPLRILRPLKILAMFMCVILSVQIVSLGFNENFFGSVHTWTKEMFVSLIGNEIKQDNAKVYASGTRTYGSVEEFEKAENIDISVPTWLPNDANIESIIYSFSNKVNTVFVLYNKASLEIDLNKNIANGGNSEKTYVEDNVTYYIFESENIIIWFDGINSYNLTCEFSSSSEYEKIIKNIK